MKNYNFAQPQWADYFVCGHSDRWPGRNDFVQLDDSIANYVPEQEGYEYYVSAVTKERFDNGVTVNFRCMFESYGAPIVLLTDDLTENPDGTVTYGAHYEVCMWENGCNVWYIVPFAEDEERRIKAYKTGFANFDLSCGEMIDVTVRIRGKFMDIDVNGNNFTVADPYIPEKFHVGITACEGRNRIYSLSVQ